MTQRILTGLALTAVLAVALVFGGWVFAVLYSVAMGLSIYEFYQALKASGRNTIQWPVWVCIACAIPLFLLTKDKGALALVVTTACFASCINAVYRPKPALEDFVFSCVPIFSVMLPGMCMLSFLQLDSRLSQTLWILESFGVALMGDTFALFVGRKFGTKKLCPLISPNKTVEGAVGGLVGSLFFGVGCAWVCSFFGEVPPLWHFALLGLIGGFAGQVGDMFASLVKRHCKIKDFSDIFPGHGGMMDRLDSVFFTTVVMYIYVTGFVG